jgi:hypothetical protein
MFARSSPAKAGDPGIHDGVANGLEQKKEGAGYWMPRFRAARML